ncbi:family 20 glycosylhydrolase [Macrococcus lamae]|uniref:beta-N-acetylhexosaminidase n=1 Tax=Macrococcus lamae TaxID=198484 RepID=A0A4R6BSB6_9STAP|nr:family 20 glycosylhydrolase [Macrococcus lamae]TDM05280.1 hypothetical protein ERX29_10245 [Macrococcus lamae]
MPDHSYKLQQGVMIDCARRYYSVDILKKIIDEIAAGSGDFIQLHFSDNEGYRITSDYLEQALNVPNTDYLTAAELNELITYANSINVQVIPDFDVPGHSKYWMNRFHELHPEITICSDFDNSLVDFFNNESALLAVRNMIEEITELFYQPKFQQKIVIGGDEVPGSGNYQKEYIQFINTVANYTVSKGYTPVIWNDSVNYDGIQLLHRDIEILYWQQPENGLAVTDFSVQGYSVYNYNFYTLAFLPDSKHNADAINEQSEYIKNNYEVNSFCYNGDPYKKVESDNIAGSAITFWGEQAGGMSNEQLLNQILPLIRAYLNQ